MSYCTIQVRKMGDVRSLVVSGCSKVRMANISISTFTRCLKGFRSSSKLDDPLARIINLRARFDGLKYRFT